ncbi:hypothetical protein CVT25_009173 [Psilocybe cyanescens]|uniref:Uncharacterized protein n=1 Tax=Psilocybe cyanescens TaxID=93625 RepID=A0A409VRV6_PSICY|nr:hypothetical protein CVT25_009173 [Psilocybe cyanescens]
MFSRGSHGLNADATKIGPNEPKYPSNLSAVLYELGQYLECITAIRKAWTRLRARNPTEGKLPTPIESDPLAIKLATRFAKANVNTVASKAASLHDMLSPDVDLDTDIEKFVKLEREGSDDTKIQEMKAAWDQWQNLRDECAQHTSAECGKITDSAAARLRATPILKSSP